MIGTIKLVAGILVVTGAVIGFLNAPHAIQEEDSSRRRKQLAWIGWKVSSCSAILYIVLDYLEGL